MTTIGIRSATVVLGALLFAFGAAPCYAKEPYKVGAVLSITGGASFLGEPEKNTLLLVQDQINKSAEKINGHPLELVIEDSQTDPQKAVIATKRLLEDKDIVAVIGPSTTPETMAVIPFMTEAKTPLVSCAAGSSITQPVEQRYWIFKTPQYDYSAVEAIYTYLKTKNIKSIGILSVTDGYGDSGRKALKDKAAQYGITIVADETYGPKDSDMTTQLTKIKSAKAEAVVNWSTGQSQIVVTRNWHDLKMGVPLLQSHGWGSKKNIEKAGKAAEGVIAPLGRLVVWDKISPKSAVLKKQQELLKKFSKEYEDRYQGEPGTFGGHAYDAVMMIVEALKKVGPDKKKVRDYIETTIKNWPGTGGIFNISPQDHCGLDKDAFEMVVVKNGDWEILK